MAAPTLDTYLVDLQRLLHDTSNNFFTSSQLTDYINQARQKVAVDTNCVKLLQSLTLSPGVELYPFSAFPAGSNTINVLSMNVAWGTLRYSLRKWSWELLDARGRALIGWQENPAVFSVYGENSLYIAPTPNQAYQAQCNTAILPDDLITGLTPEQIPFLYTSLVPFYAASLAKQYQQMWQEAERFEQDYERKKAQTRSGVTGAMPGNIYTARI